MNVEIKKARVKDRKKINSLIKEAFGITLPVEKFSKVIEAVDEDKIVGVVFENEAEEGEIKDELIINSFFQGKGIGRRLFSKKEDEHRSLFGGVRIEKFRFLKRFGTAPKEFSIFERRILR